MDEPSEEMLKAGMSAGGLLLPARARDVYRAMRSVAPLNKESAFKACAEKARQYAACYPLSSDGQNTFVMFAEWAEERAAHDPA